MKLHNDRHYLTADDLPLGVVAAVELDRIHKDLGGTRGYGDPVGGQWLRLSNASAERWAATMEVSTPPAGGEAAESLPVLLATFRDNDCLIGHNGFTRVEVFNMAIARCNSHAALVAALERIQKRTKGYVQTDQATYCERQDFEESSAALHAAKS